MDKGGEEGECSHPCAERGRRGAGGGGGRGSPEETTGVGGGRGTLTDSGALMNTLLLPSWNWSLSMLTECSKWRTPCFSSPLHEGQVALVRMAYLGGQAGREGSHSDGTTQSPGDRLTSVLGLRGRVSTAVRCQQVWCSRFRDPSYPRPSRPFPC